MSFAVSVSGDLRCFASFSDILLRSLSEQEVVVPHRGSLRRVKINSLQFVTFSTQILVESQSMQSPNIHLAHLFVVKLANIQEHSSREIEDWLGGFGPVDRPLVAVVAVGCDKTRRMRLDASKMDLKRKLLKKQSGAVAERVKRRLRTDGLLTLLEFAGGNSPLMNHSAVNELARLLGQLLAEAIPVWVVRGDELSGEKADWAAFVNVSSALAELLLLLRAEEESILRLAAALDALLSRFSPQRGGSLDAKGLFLDLDNLGPLPGTRNRAIKCGPSDQLFLMLRVVEQQTGILLSQGSRDRAAAVVCSFLQEVSSVLRRALPADSVRRWMAENLRRTFPLFEEGQSSHCLLLLDMLRRELWWSRASGEAGGGGTQSRGSGEEGEAGFYLRVVERLWRLGRKWPSLVSAVGPEVGESLLEMGADALAESWLWFAFHHFSRHRWAELSLSVRLVLRRCHREDGADKYHDLVWLAAKDSAAMDELVGLTEKASLLLAEEQAITAAVSIGPGLSLRLVNRLPRPLALSSLRLPLGDQPAVPLPCPSALPPGESLVEAPFKLDHVGVFRLTHVEIGWNKCLLRVPVEEPVTIPNLPRVQLTIAERVALVGVVSEFSLTVDNSPPGVPVLLRCDPGLLVDPGDFVLSDQPVAVRLMCLPPEDDCGECVVRRVTVCLGDYSTDIELSFDPLLSVECSLRQSANDRKYVVAGVANCLAADPSPRQDISVEVFGEEGVGCRSLSEEGGRVLLRGVKLTYVWACDSHYPAAFSVTAFLRNDLALRLWQHNTMKLKFVHTFDK